MYGGCAFALVLLLLILTTFNVPPALSNAATERCVYTVGDYVRLNQSQSRDIICSSPRFHGSTYSHKLDSGMTTNFSANQLDMIHCEAALGMYNHLDLYERATRDGIIKSLSSSGACVISDRGANCTQVILYVNLTYYDQRNGSIIPVCAFTSDHNLECFCIRYQTLGSTPDDPDIEKCKPVTTEVMTENATATNPESGFDNQTQPTNGCPAVAGASGRYPAATFQGTVSVLIIVIVLQAVVIVIMIVAVFIRKKPLTKPKATSDKVKYIKSSVQQWSDRTHADNGEHQSFSDDEHENEHDVFSVHEEKHTLLRSKSCPAASPTAVNPDEFNF